MSKKQTSQSGVLSFDQETPGLVPAHESASESPSVAKPHKSITVVCACIMRDGGQQVLLSMRKAPGVVGLDGKWELPGGKIEFGETPEQAVVREIREELGLHDTPSRLLPYLHTNLWEYEHMTQHVVLACYECELEPDASPGLGDDAEWFYIKHIDFASTLPGTKEFVSLAANTEWFDRVFIVFENAESSSPTRRFTVATQPTLYSRYGLVKYWGQIGTAPRTKIEEFDSPKELDEQIFETARRRLAGGYHIRTLTGPDNPPEVLLRIRELARQRDEYLTNRDSN